MKSCDVTVVYQKSWPYYIYMIMAYTDRRSGGAKIRREVFENIYFSGVLDKFKVFTMLRKRLQTLYEKLYEIVNLKA